MENGTLKSTPGSIGKLRRARQSKEGSRGNGPLLSERVLPDKDESKHLPGRKHEVT
jgi:hypothetical protein